MSNKQIKLSSNVSALRFIQAAQTKVKQEELKKKQEETLGWYLPGFENTRTKGLELANKVQKLENIHLLSRKSFNSYNPIIDKHNSAIISRRKNYEKLKNERIDEEIIYNMFKDNKSYR